MARTRTVRVEFGDSREEQVRATHFIQTMAKQRISEVCKTCGGITDDRGPTAARCVCKPVEG